jgi:hypothetical protein
MIAYIDSPPTIEVNNGGFLVTFKSGNTETQMMLTMHAMTHLAGRGTTSVKEAQTKAAISAMEVLPFRPAPPASAFRQEFPDEGR